MFFRGRHHRRRDRAHQFEDNHLVRGHPLAIGAGDGGAAVQACDYSHRLGQGARSFGDAVSRALDRADLDDAPRALWLLHDDSRPSDDSC